MVAPLAPAPGIMPLVEEEVTPNAYGAELPFSAPNWSESTAAGAALPAGMVDPEKAAELTEEEIINQVKRCRSESARVRSDLEPGWRRAEAAFYAESQYEDSKEAWQSDLVVPTVSEHIRTAVAMMQGALLDQSEFFTVEREGAYADDAITNLVQKWLELAVDDTAFVKHFLTMWQDSFLYGTGWMVIEQEEYIDRSPRVVERPLYQDPQMAIQASMQGLPMSEKVVETDALARSRTVLRPISPWHLYPDPFALQFEDCKYVIREQLVDEEDLISARDAGQYQFDELGPPANKFPADRDGSISPTSYAENEGSGDANRRRHLVTTYHGNIKDNDGNMVCENWRVVIANDKTLLSIGPNPLFSGKYPYICSTPLEHRETLWGRSLVESDVRVQEEMTSLMNLMLDDARFSVLSAFQVDEGQSDEPGEIDSIEPGRVYRGRGQFINKLQFQSQANSAFPLYSQLQSIGDRSTSITEFVAGTPTSRGRPSATEVSTKSQAGQAYLQQLARRLEEDDVERGLGLLYEFLVQFGGDDSNPKLGQLLEGFGGPQILFDPVARFELLDKPVSLTVNGISQVMSREGMNGKLMEALNVSMQLGMPPQSQIPLFYAMLSNLGLDPRQLGYPADAQEMEMLQQQMMMQQQNQGAAPAGGSPPREGSQGRQEPSAPSQANLDAQSENL